LAPPLPGLPRRALRGPHPGRAELLERRSFRVRADRGDRRPFTLIYANARWDDVIFREEIEALTSRLDLTLVHVIEQPHEGWHGPTGRITEALLRDALPQRPQDFEYFLCGPKPVCELAMEWLRGMGVPLARIHFELFDMV
jgi:ferredoxin-NADP reductase